MFVLTFFALYGTDCNSIYGSVDGDELFGILSFITMVLFLAELAIASFVKEHYFMRAFFWLDFLAAISLIGDIPWLAREIFPSGFAAARAGRASRAGTRAGRLVRVIRLIRLTRLIKLLNIKDKNANDEDEDEDLKELKASAPDEDNAGGMTNQLTKLTTVKVIVALLLMLSVTPFLDATPSNESRLKGLTFLKSQMVMQNNTCNNVLSADSITGVPDYEDDCYDVSDLVQSFNDQYPNVIYLAAQGEDQLTTGPIAKPRDCAIPEDCFPVDEGLRLGEMEIVYLLEDGESADDLTSLSESQEKPDYIVTFSNKWSMDRDSKYSMLMTTFIIVLLCTGMLAFNNDASVISKTITGPLQEISVEMVKVSKMKLYGKSIMKPSNVYEMRRMQRSLLHMKKGITSFAKFIPKDVVRNMLNSGQEASLGVKPRKITTFFSDIANFTSICEQMAPEPLLALLTEYFDSMSPLVIDTGGSVLDYIGDAVLACWNAPLDVPDHAYQCTMQCLEMHTALEVLRIRWKKMGFPAVHIRCGVHTGLVFVGNIGGTRRMKYSVLGDGVAMAERCEDGNKKYSSRVMVTEATMREPRMRESFLVRKVDYIQVKDFAGPCAIYQIVCLKFAATDDENEMCRKHNAGMECYRKRQFQEAIDWFEQVLQFDVPSYVIDNYKGEDKAATQMIHRCRSMMQNPPPLDWDIAAYGAI